MSVNKKKDVPRSVRGLDEKLFKEARKNAMDNGLSIGVWINEAIREKLMGQNIENAGIRPETLEQIIQLAERAKMSNADYLSDIIDIQLKKSKNIGFSG
jgi:hypothetical protein